MSHMLLLLELAIFAKPNMEALCLERALINAPAALHLPLPS